jgi:hypothetical protein
MELFICNDPRIRHADAMKKFLFMRKDCLMELPLKVLKIGWEPIEVREGEKYLFTILESHKRINSTDHEWLNYEKNY